MYQLHADWSYNKKDSDWKSGKRTTILDSKPRPQLLKPPPAALLSPASLGRYFSPAPAMESKGCGAPGPWQGQRAKEAEGPSRMAEYK